MLDRMRLRLLLIGAVIATLTALTPTARSAEPTVEDRVIAMINAERSEKLVVHWGLLAAARNHSASMAREGGLSHEGADERVNSAPPDPGEFNGAPDDGFGVAAWCENVTYTIVASAEEAAQRIYGQWHRGGAHERCMLDTSRNVGAVGVYYDGQNWWATFIAEVDATPPGAPPTTAKPKPAAPADEVATPKPRASAVPSEAVEDDADADAAPSVDDAAPVGTVVVATASPDVPEAPDEDTAPPTAAPERGGRTVDEAAPMASSPPRDVPAIAESAAVPVVPDPAIGWPELAAVAALLSIATVVLRRWFVDRSVLPPAVPAVEEVSETELLSRV